MIEPSPQEREDIERAMARLKQGATSEVELQDLLALKPTTARRFCDDLVALGVAYRHNRELHLNVVVLKAAAEPRLIPRILASLMRMPGTAISLAHELEEPLEVVRATLEQLRGAGQVTASTCGPLMIYRLA